MNKKGIEMFKEFSCGAVVYKIQNANPVFLLVSSKQNGRWGFPKGHVENNESEIETAKREIFEETGIKNLKFIEDFRQENIYVIDKLNNCIKGDMVEKHSVYFLALALADTLDFDKNEIAELRWTDIKQALELLFFTNQKEVINLAYRLIIGG
jgi:8-oxo-dGTP pyrophosphatase MutT (NUDIX family)